MAVDSYDSTTGRPQFLDTGAPDIAVDSTAVGIYAADVGNRVVRADLSELNAYPYERAGLMGHALDTKTDYVHDGTGWVAVLSDTGWLPIGSLAANWSVQTPDTNDYRVLNGVLYLRGRLNATSGATTSNIFSTALPASARPAKDVPKLLGVTDGSAALYIGVITATGQLVVFKGGSAVTNFPLEAFGGIPIG